MAPEDFKDLLISIFSCLRKQLLISVGEEAWGRGVILQFINQKASFILLYYIFLTFCGIEVEPRTSCTLVK